MTNRNAIEARLNARLEVIRTINETTNKIDELDITLEERDCYRIVLGDSEALECFAVGAEIVAIAYALGRERLILEGRDHADAARFAGLLIPELS